MYEMSEIIRLLTATGPTLPGAQQRTQIPVQVLREGVQTAVTRATT